MLNSILWSASLSAGSGKFSMPTSRSMFLYTAAPCFGATILPHKKRESMLVKPKRGEGNGCSDFEVENSSEPGISGLEG